MSVADAIRFGSGTVRLRARWIVPIDAPPVENGEVVIEGGRIEHVGKSSGDAGHDFGCAAILPGFVNAHCHLQYTVLRGLLEDMTFLAGVRALAALKMHLNLEDWVASATLGAAEMLAAGVTTLGDTCDTGASLQGLIASGQRGVVYREVFGIERESNPTAVIQVLKQRLTDMRAHAARAGVEDRVRVGVSPHSAYAVKPELFQSLAGYVAAEGLRQAVPLAESPAEVRLIREGQGPIAEMLQQRNIPWETPGVSPASYLDRCGVLLPGTLLVHGVHLDTADIALLSERRCALVHCPRSNGKSGVGIAPVAAWRDAGLPVGLGTDSVASNNSVDMFEEMRHAIFFARTRSQDPLALTARDALQMATLGGAMALGVASEVGSLTRGKRADLCVVRLDGLHVTPTAEDNPVAALVYGCRASDVALTMVGGRVLYESGRHTLLSVAHLRNAVGALRKRLAREVARTVGAAH